MRSVASQISIAFLEIIASNAKKFFYFYAVVLILLAISPSGNLSGNEEMYYGLAKKFLEPSWNGEFSSFISSGDYRIISDTLIGTLVSKIGFSATQIIGSLLAAVLYGFCITSLARVLDLENIYGLLGIMSFILLGQNLIGREWLFEDFEAKIFAYVAVLFSIVYYLRNSPAKMIILLSLATYFHLLVGVAWFGLMILARMAQNRAALSEFKYICFYIVASAPIIVIAARGFLGDSFVAEPGLPSPSYIYSYIRQWKMVLPFYSISGFVLFWMPGIAVFISILIVLFATQNRAGDEVLSRLSFLLLTGTCVVFVFLGISIIDAEGVFGKFYPYRFTSLLFLLLILYLTAMLRDVDTSGGVGIGQIFFFTLSPFFVVSTATNFLLEVREVTWVDQDKGELYEVIKNSTKKEDTILIAPDLEKIFFDFEREVSRPSLVTFKYIPTSNATLIEWYKRRKFKEAVFSGSRYSGRDYNYSYLISSNTRLDEKLHVGHKKWFENNSYILWGISSNSQP